MPVEVWWYLPGRILYSPGSLVKEDIAARNAIALEMIESEGQPPMVHTLIDHTNRYSADDLRAQPRQASYYTSASSDEVRQNLISHPLLGWVLSINTPTSALKMAGTVMSQQSSYRWRSFETLDDALDFLQRIDPTLPDLRPIEER